VASYEHDGTTLNSYTNPEHHNTQCHREMDIWHYEAHIWSYFVCPVHTGDYSRRFRSPNSATVAEFVNSHRIGQGL